MNIQNFSFHFSWPKLICSLPVLVILLYFVPPLGVILTIGRYFIYGNYRYYRVPAALLIIACLCLVPRLYELLQNNFGNHIPAIQPLIDFRAHELFPKITTFGRFTAIMSIILLFLSQILRNFIGRASAAINLMQKASVKDTNPSKTKSTLTHDNPAKHQTDQTTPHVVKCKNCGAATQIIGTVGKCKSCRTDLEWHPKK
jgi:hypothetical protein